MNDKDNKYLDECIEKDRDLKLFKIEDIHMLQELHNTYLQYYNFFNMEFDSFNNKLANLSTLVTVLLGFIITIYSFLIEQNFFKITTIYNALGKFITAIIVITLIYLLVITCVGQSFKKFLTLQSQFPLEAAFEFQKDNKEYYKKMIFCLYKTIRKNSNNLETNKQKFLMSYNTYILCVIMTVISFIFNCIGGLT